MLTVNGDGAVVERQLAGGELGCPLCGGALGGWGHARPRPVRMAEGPDVVLAPRRSRCPGCGATHVLLPAWCLSRRADEGAVIGSALQAAAAGAGHRTIAAGLGRPASTVRGWLRRFAARAEAVRAFFTVLLARTSPDPVMPAGRPAGGGRGVGDRRRGRGGGAALAPARHGAGVGGGVGGQRRAADRPGLAGRGPLHELTRYRPPGRREIVCRSLTPMTGGGAPGGHEQGGRGRAGAAGAGPGDRAVPVHADPGGRRPGAVHAAAGQAGAGDRRTRACGPVGTAGAADPVDPGPVDPAVAAGRVRRAGPGAAPVPAADPAGGDGAGGGAEEGEPGQDRGAGAADPACPGRVGAG